MILKKQGVKVRGKILLELGGLHIPSALALYMSGVYFGGGFKGALKDSSVISPTGEGSYLPQHLLIAVFSMAGKAFNSSKIHSKVNPSAPIPSIASNWSPSNMGYISPEGITIF